MLRLSAILPGVGYGRWQGMVPRQGAAWPSDTSCMDMVAAMELRWANHHGWSSMWPAIPKRGYLLGHLPINRGKEGLREG